MRSGFNLNRLTRRKGINPIPKISVTDWSDSYRQLPSESAEPGRWRTSRVPYLKAVMDAFTQNDIHRVVVKSSSQIGKSEAILNVVGRYAHLDPCNIMIIQPTLEMAEDFSKSRLSKMIADTKVLTSLFYEKSKTRDTTQTILSKFFTGGRLVLGGANSPAGLASRPIRILLCDEVDRFPLSAGNEGDPIGLAEKRTTTYWNYKIGLFSTPTQEGASRIEVEYKLGTQEEWRHKCPNCGEFEKLDYRNMKCDYVQSKNDLGVKTVIVNNVKWRCPNCGFEFGELAIKNSEQKYFAQNPDALKNGVRSFWLNAFSSPWLTWKGIMKEWIESQGAASRESVVMNTRFGETYELRGEYNDESIFLERRQDYDGEIPSGVLLLTAAVDVQANRLEYEVAGWGAGERRWGILKGMVRGEPNQLSTWRELDAVLDRIYYFGNGTPIKISRTFIDSGYSASIVYDYCRANAAKGRFAIKGVGQSGAPLLYKYTYPKGAGIILTMLGVNDGKQEIFSRLNLTSGEGAMLFPNDDKYFKRGYDSVYFKQLISERKVMRKVGGLLQQVWEPISAHERNEALDIACYNLAAMKSCIGNSKADEFWSRRQELLSEGEPMTEEKVAEKKVVAWREVDFW